MADLNSTVSSSPSSPSSVDVGNTSTDAGSPAADTSLGGMIDSLLATPSSAAEATPAPDTEQDAAQAQTATPDAGKPPAVASPEAPVDNSAKSQEAAPAAAKTEAEVEEPEDDSDLDQAQDNAEAAQNLLDLKRPRGQRIYQAYKAYKSIAEAIGQELTVESAKNHLEAFSDKLAMEHEFTSGDPVAQRNFLNYWNSSNPEAMAQTASQMIDYFAANNPNAYMAVAMPALNRYLNHMYARASQEQNPDVQKALVYTARMMDWDINDKFRDDAALPKPQDQSVSTANELAQLRQQLQQQGQQQFMAQRNQWNQKLDESNNSKLSEESEKALNPLKSTTSQRLYQAAVRDFEEAVRAHIAKDVEGQRIYDIRRMQAQNRLTSEDISALSTQYAQRVSRAVRAVAPSFLKEAGVTAKAQSTERHQVLQAAAAAGIAPNGAGQPVQNSIIPPAAQYGSRTEQMEGTIDALLGVTKRR